MFYKCNVIALLKIPAIGGLGEIDRKFQFIFKKSLFFVILCLTFLLRWCILCINTLNVYLYEAVPINRPFWRAGR